VLKVFSVETPSVPLTDITLEREEVDTVKEGVEFMR
jgi:hypothetical protein